MAGSNVDLRIDQSMGGSHNSMVVCEKKIVIKVKRLLETKQRSGKGYWKMYNNPQ